MMKMYRLLPIVLVFLLSGCGVMRDYRQAHNAQQSQMFTKFDDFRPGPDSGVDLVWAPREIKDIKQLNTTLASYDNIMFDQIWLVFDDKSRYGGLSHEQVDEVSKYLVDNLKQKASTHYKLVDEPAEKTIRVSIALTNIETPNPILAVTSTLLPVGLGISSVSKVVTGEFTNVGSATIELMFSDANTGEPILAVIDRHAGSKDLSTMIDSTDDAKDAINWWVERLGSTLRGEPLQ